jgi:cell division protease FtsH
MIDEEVSKLIESQYQRALELLGKNQDKLAQLADRLLTSEVIFKEDLEAIFGKRQWDPIEEVSTEVVAEIETPGEISTPEPTENTEEPTTDA